MPVPIIDDSLNEPSETFRATLSLIDMVTSPGTTIGANNPAIVTINDNEGNSITNHWFIILLTTGLLLVFRLCGSI